ncbi:D-arginine dehydrogenase [Tistlia consotensis]|uniref:D-arginine dehydrogenase n=1 Tax=Tistlia consotensis USBA 355 TaxID=560819 RepID=A0A1Y6C590_9PROT|nr:FAD-binding oxidoreductase [Tistlia consotensis]SMF46287.1 D-arginine dehydrogenase [Tistlia consotensis USBA 355]SNR78640.1 D-arginine dehydrogenase [Tistlia consotensis]
MTRTCDILVVGGGIAGISAAARLAPDARVTVLERETAIGYHATGRSAAIFIANYGNATLRALNAASAPELAAPDFVEGSLLSERGELLVATEAEMPALERHLAESTGVEALTPAEALHLVPVLRAELIRGAAIERAASDIDVDRLLQGFARLLQAHGGTIVTGAEAARIGRAGRVWRVETAAGAFEAPVLVNAAGAWADAIARLAGVAPVGLKPLRRSAALLPAPDGRAVERWPLFAPVSETWYARPEAGKLMVSPADEDPVAPHDAWADEMVLAEGLDRFERMTTVRVTRVERSWAGLRSFVADRTPVVGFAPDAAGFFWLAGQGGYGVQTAPALSWLAADLVLGRQPRMPPAVVATLSPGRPGLAAGR